MMCLCLRTVKRSPSLKNRTARKKVQFGSGQDHSGVVVTRPHDAGVAQLVRAPACHAGGRGFKSRHSRHSLEWLVPGRYFQTSASNLVIKILAFGRLAVTPSSTLWSIGPRHPG